MPTRRGKQSQSRLGIVTLHDSMQSRQAKSYGRRKKITLRDLGWRTAASRTEHDWIWVNDNGAAQTPGDGEEIGSLRWGILASLHFLPPALSTSGGLFARARLKVVCVEAF